MNIKPLYDRVIIKRMEEEKMSAGGIVIPDSATEKPIKGEVIAVGSGKSLDNGSVRAPQVKVGDKVLFGKIGRATARVSGRCGKTLRTIPDSRFPIPARLQPSTAKMSSSFTTR